MKEGWSFSGPEMIASADRPSLSSNPPALPVSRMTPIDPVSVALLAKIRAAGRLTM